MFWGVRGGFIPSFSLSKTNKRGINWGKVLQFVINTGIYYTIKKILNNTQTDRQTHRHTDRQTQQQHTHNTHTNRERGGGKGNERTTTNQQTDQQRETTEQPPPPTTRPPTPPPDHQKNPKQSHRKNLKQDPHPQKNFSFSYTTSHRMTYNNPQPRHI